MKSFVGLIVALGLVLGLAWCYRPTIPESLRGNWIYDEPAFVAWLVESRNPSWYERYKATNGPPLMSDIRVSARGIVSVGARPTGDFQFFRIKNRTDRTVGSAKRSPNHTPFPSNSSLVLQAAGNDLRMTLEYTDDKFAGPGWVYLFHRAPIGPQLKQP